jgi:hypothetical protein
LLDLGVLVEPLLVHRMLCEQIGVLHLRVLTVVGRRGVPAPDDGAREPVVALTYRATVDMIVLAGLVPGGRQSKYRSDSF